MKLVVGLGNPGKEYSSTRHNIGFIVLDNYIGEDKWSLKFNGLYITKLINGEKVIFLKPQSFMNLSGSVVKKFVDYYDISLDNILVIQDDLDLECGKLRVKKDSSAGGHNGIKDIIALLGSKDFLRLKIGISQSVGDTKDYVLSSFSKKEMGVLNENMSVYLSVIDDFLDKDFSYLMNKYNGIFK